MTHAQKYAIYKKSTIFTQSLRNLTSMSYSMYGSDMADPFFLYFSEKSSKGKMDVKMIVLLVFIIFFSQISVSLFAPQEKY